MKNQHQKILDILDDGMWHCSQEFQRNYIPEYRSRINDLRIGKTADHKIHGVIDEPCLNRCGGNHNRNTRRWKSSSASFKRSDEWCTRCDTWLSHTRDCPTIRQAQKEVSGQLKMNV